MQRRAAAVDGHGDDRFAGELGERLGDRPLDRVLRVAVGRGVPSVHDAGREHGRVLARAVLGDGRLRAAGTDPGGRARPRRPGSRGCSAGPPPRARRPRGCGRPPPGGTAPPSGWRRPARARRPGRSRPARTMAEAWIGLLADRAKTAPVGSPRAHSTEPSGAVTTTVPRWTLSTNPPRTTWARTGASVSAVDTALGRFSWGASGTAVSVPERVRERAGPQEASRTDPVCR